MTRKIHGLGDTLPLSRGAAINFLETQWSSITANKIYGIEAEVRFKHFLEANSIHYCPGGWFIAPGKCTLASVPSLERICVLPRRVRFSWQQPIATTASALSLTEVWAYALFKQLGVRTLFIQPDGLNEHTFRLPAKRQGSTPASYPRDYSLDFLELSPQGDLANQPIAQVLGKFPKRQGRQGMRCYRTGRISQNAHPWTDVDTVSDLFWFEYARYFVQVEYLVSNADLDMVLIGPSGAGYPVEMKSKSPRSDRALGDWFGLDMGPYAKLAFFTANGLNTDGLYVVEEVDALHQHVEWLGIRFSDVVKCCSWVGQGGGTGMTGGRSSTYKIPKAAFTPLSNLLPSL